MYAIWKEEWERKERLGKLKADYRDLENVFLEKIFE